MLLTRPNLIRQAAAGALVLASSRRASAQQPPLTIRYGSTPTASGVPAYWAAQNGMFREAGLDVTVTKGGNSSTITAALSAGALDIGETTAIPLVNAHIHGLDIVAFCSNFIYVAGRPAFNALVVSTGSPYRTPRDLNGQTVSCAAVRDTAWLVTRAFLDAGAPR
jgi:NitT/TauT family transport system substrate-binding protein